MNWGLYLPSPEGEGDHRLVYANGFYRDVEGAVPYGV